MKHKITALLALLTCLTAAHQQASLADEPARVQVNYGIGFLPLDFYIDRREQLGINEDQVQVMKKIIENMRGPGEKLAKEMQERTKALQEAVGQNPVNAEASMERFKAVLEVENQMKAMQFRARMEMRQVLRPEQYEKVRAMAAKAQQSKQGGSSGSLQEKLNQVRQQIAQHTGGKVPREVLEKLERIEQAAKQGHAAEAEKQLNALLQHLKGGKGHGQANVEQQMRQLKEAMKNAKSPEERQKIEQHMRKLHESAQSGGNHPEGKPRAGGMELDKLMHRINEVAEHTDKPEVREQLKAAAANLKEAARSGNKEAAHDIMQAIQPLLSKPKP